MSDGILVIWLVLQFVFDSAVLGITGYVVFWKGHSGWWFVVAIMTCSSGTLFKVLRKRFGVREPVEEEG